MLDDVGKIAQEHPYLVGGGVLIVLLLMMRGSSSSGSDPGIAASLQSQQIASDASVKLSSVNASVLSDRYDMATDMYKTNASLTASSNAMTASVIENILSHIDTGDTIDANVIIQREKNALQRQQSDNALLLGSRSLQTQIQMNQDDNNTLLSQQAQQIQSIVGNLPSLLQHDETMQKLTGTTAQALAQTSAQSAQAIASIQAANAERLASIAARPAEIQAKSNRQSSTISDIGSIIGIGASLFSDRRLKRNIKRIGTHRLGIGIYSFEYVWGESATGVMADEVMTVKPDAVTMHDNGYLMVDYAGL